MTIEDFEHGVIAGPTGENVEPLYYVVSRERLRLAVGLKFPASTTPIWWMPDGYGYTANLAEAGKFTRREVKAIVRKSLPDRRPDAGDFGVPVDLAALVFAMVRTGVEQRDEEASEK